jgi:hypothetical protein
MTLRYVSRKHVPGEIRNSTDVEGVTLEQKMTGFGIELTAGEDETADTM